MGGLGGGGTQLCELASALQELANPVGRPDTHENRQDFRGEDGINVSGSEKTSCGQDLREGQPILTREGRVGHLGGEVTWASPKRHR